MRTRSLASLCLFLGWSLQAGQALHAQTQEPESRSYFKDWLAACSASSGCSASTYRFRSEDTDAIEHQLRLSPLGGDGGYRLSFLSSSAVPDERSDLVLQVDDNTPYVLAPGKGYRLSQDEPGRSVALIDDSGRLIPEMRAGGSISLAFTDRAGQPRRIDFSLWGLTASMNFMADQTKSASAGGIALGSTALVAGDWSERLGDFLPAMRRCLVATPGGPAQVSKAWPMNRGMIGVRTLGPDGRRWDCVIEAQNQDPDKFAAVPSGQGLLPGEADPLFTPPGQTPPGQTLPDERCYRHDRGFDRNGGFAGWLSYPGC